jgi:hypothetical protein
MTVAARMTDDNVEGQRVAAPVHSAGDGRRLHIRLRHRPPFLIVESLSISKPLDAMVDTKNVN